MATKRATTARRKTAAKKAARKKPTTRRKRAVAAKAATAPAIVAAAPYESAPDPPETLGDYGRSCWSRLAPLLVQLRLLTPLHLEAFEALCDCWDNYQRKKLFLRAHPQLETFTTESGYEQRSPHAVALERSYEQFIKLLPRFGLTPEASRKMNRLTGGGPPDDDPLASFAAAKYADDDEHQPPR